MALEGTMKKLLLILSLILLTGCASYDWSFNKAHERAEITGTLNG